MVPDGPGLSGAMYESIVQPLMSATNQAYSIYLMDHRGTGQSIPSLHCPDEPAINGELPEGDCITYLDETYGDTIEYMNTYAIVRDYISLTELITNSDDRVLFYGSGYGAFVINQIIIQDPNLIDLVVMDSALLPSIVNYDEYAHDAGLRLLNRCQSFSECRDKVDNNDPEDIIEDLFNNFPNLDCPRQLGLEKSEIQTIFRNMATDLDYRPLLLPVVVRVLRCNGDDLEYLRTGIETFNEFYYETYKLRAENSSFVTGESYVFRNNIQINEFLRIDRGFQPSSTELVAISEQLYFSNYLPTFVSQLSNTWIWGENNNLDPYEFGTSEVPMLILSGEFDMQANTIYSARLADIYDNRFQRFLEIPFAGHNVLFDSPTQSGGICGFELIAEFINQGPGNWDPYELSIQCISRLEPIDFDASTQKTLALSELTFGNRDPWGSGNIPVFGGSVSFSSDYVFNPFSSNDLPTIPNLSLSRIIVFDSYDTSRPQTNRNTLSYISTGILPPSGWFSSDGAVIGSASTLTNGFIIILLCLFISILF